MIIVFFCNLFSSNWSTVLLSTNSVLEKQKNTQSSMRRRAEETKITNPHRWLKSLHHLSSAIKNILLLHRVWDPLCGFLRATAFFWTGIVDSRMEPCNVSAGANETSIILDPYQHAFTYPVRGLEMKSAPHGNSWNSHNLDGTDQFIDLNDPRNFHDSESFWGFGKWRKNPPQRPEFRIRN